MIGWIAWAGAAEWPDLGAPPATAAGDGTRDAALVVAIEDYAAAQDLPGALANGRAWAAWLQQARKVPATAIKTLVNAQATREQILQDARGVAARVQPGGRLWVVYIGHGAPSESGSDGVLVGWDAQQTATSIGARGVAQSELVAALAGAQSETVMVVDACFSGKTAAGDLAPGLAPMKVTGVTVGPAVTFLSAAGSDEYAGPLSDGRRPAFSYLVLGALRGWGDADGDGEVTAQEAVTYANDALFTTVVGRTQTPNLYGPDVLLGRSGGEAGPDLQLLGTAGASSGTARVGEAQLQLGDAVDFAAMAAAAEAADRAAAEAERTRVAAAAALEAERRRRLDAAAAEIRSAAMRDFAAVQGLVASPTAAGKPVLEAYLGRYGSASVTVDGVTEAVVVAEVERVRVALGQPEGSEGAAAGTEVTSPTLGRMIAVPAGSFQMGSPASEAGRDDDEILHEVRITRGFLLMEHEVTQAQWQSVMGTNPSNFAACGEDCPVEHVSWDDAVAFAAKVSAREGVTYRLPSEAEWEYAARAGQGSLYSGSSELGAVGWTSANGGGTTHPVCGKARNAWGFCDLTGNVWEWTSDWYGTYPTGAVADPRGPTSGLVRVYRGGGWNFDPRFARVANRVRDVPGFRLAYLGFRLARDP